MDPRTEQLIEWLNTYAPQSLEGGGEALIRASLTYDDALAVASAQDFFAGMAIQQNLQSGYDSDLPPTDAQRAEAAAYIKANPEFVEGSNFEGKSVEDMTDAEFKQFQAAAFIANVGFETIGDVEELTETDLTQPQDVEDLLDPPSPAEVTRREEEETERIGEINERVSDTLTSLGVSLETIEKVVGSDEWQPWVVEAWEVDRGGISQAQIEANRTLGGFYRGTFAMESGYGDPMNNPYRYGEKVDPFSGEIIESPGMGQVGNINQWLVDNAGMGGLPMVNQADLERIQFAEVGGGQDTATAARDRIAKWGPESANRYNALIGQVVGFDVSQSDFATVNKIMTDAFDLARQSGSTVDQALDSLALQAVKQRNQRGGGGSRRFTVPYSLRTIPDYDTLANEADEAFRRKMGRRAQDYEMGLMTDHLAEMYGERNEVLIKAAKKSFSEGAMEFDVAAAAREFEAPDPAQTKARFIEENWAKEIARRETAGQSRDVNQLILNSIISGTGMVE